MKFHFENEIDAGHTKRTSWRDSTCNGIIRRRSLFGAGAMQRFRLTVESDLAGLTT